MLALQGSAVVAICSNRFHGQLRVSSPVLNHLQKPSLEQGTINTPAHLSFLFSCVYAPLSGAELEGPFQPHPCLDVGESKKTPCRHIAMSYTVPFQHIHTTGEAWYHRPKERRSPQAGIPDLFRTCGNELSCAILYIRFGIESRCVGALVACAGYGERYLPIAAEYVYLDFPKINGMLPSKTGMYFLTLF